MDINPIVCQCTNLKKEDVQRIILVIIELFSIVQRFSFYIKPSSRHLNMLCCIF